MPRAARASVGGICYYVLNRGNARRRVFYKKHYHGSGHIWQGRFKSFPIAEDDHLLTVLRYAERNPLRANLVKRAEQWEWSSARHWQEPAGRPSYLISGTVRRRNRSRVSRMGRG